MNTNHRSHRAIARRVSVKRRYGVSMPAGPSDRLRRRMRPKADEGARHTRWPGDLNPCHARFAAMPSDFLNWLDEPPAWPAGTRECIGEVRGAS